MIIRVSDIEESGVTVDDAQALATAYSDPAWRLDQGHLAFERDGADVLVRGRLDATVPLACSRCLESFPGAVRADVDVRVVPRPASGHDVELAANDLDVDFYVNDELDVDRLVETETTLALPMKPLCRQTCQGLCPVCGANRNVARCTCQERPPDPRWATLGSLAARQSR